MPTIQDFDDADENDDIGGSSGGGAPAGITGGGVRGGAPSPQRESTFVPWSRFVSANESVSNREAGELKSQVQGDVDRVTKTRDDAANAQTDAVKSNYAGYQDPRKTSGQAGTGAFLSSNSAPSSNSGFGASFGGDSGQALSSWNPPPAAAPMKQPAHATPQPQPRGRDFSGQGGQLGYAAGTINPDKLGITTPGGKVQGVNLAGSPSLHEKFGRDAWSKLVGDTQHAGDEADMLGTETGVQALIQQQNAGPLAQGGAFDAALESGAGGQGFRDIAKQYGGGALSQQLTGADANAQSQWAKLMGDVSGGAARRQGEIDESERARLAAESASQGGGAAPGGPAGSPWHPEGYGDLNSFLHPAQDSLGAIGQDVHTAGMALSPADWLTRGLGEAGVYSGQNASELFSGYVSQGNAPQNDWAVANMRNALSQIQSEYGVEAAEYFWNHMTPEMWAEYQQMGNAGFMANQMRAWLESAGYAKTQTHDTAAEAGTNQGGSSVMNQGYASGEADQGTSAEQETARNQAYADGWGSEWDRQFREGNPNPQRSE